MPIPISRVPPSNRGIDYGDHPPITPTMAATRATLRGGEREWRVYELIAKHFLASLMAPMKYIENRAEISILGEKFAYSWHQVYEEGFTAIVPHRRRDLSLNEITLHVDHGDAVEVEGVALEEGWTEPPFPLQEGELISLMDANGIGMYANPNPNPKWNRYVC